MENKNKIFFDDDKIYEKQAEQILLDLMIKRLQNEYTFEIIYTEEEKNIVFDKAIDKYFKLYPKMTENIKNKLFIYLDEIYYKTAKKAVDIAKKQDYAKMQAYYVEQAKQQIADKKRREQLEAYRKSKKKSLFQKIFGVD